MNPYVPQIAKRLSLREPQRHALKILDRVTELAPPRKGGDIETALAAIRSEFPMVTDFERDFPSLCFALATGVGKTRLMGAFITYLHQAHGMDNFFVLAPNLTIYNKLIADFTPNTPKYVFTGIKEFAMNAPVVITGENYQQGIGVRKNRLPGFDEGVNINIFNISKINSEARGGKMPLIKKLSEYLGESYFDYLAGLENLVLLMDESHRYRATAGLRAINELRPTLGLELTATPFVETPRGPVWFHNIIQAYTLNRAMADGFVKEPAVVTRKDFNPAEMSREQIERIKLEDGIALHEMVKAELDTYARDTGAKFVKPFALIIARDTTHAKELLLHLESTDFFEGRYRDKVLQVDSSRTGAEEEAMIERLLKVEDTDEPTEIVIHVNMLKEGWDVTNLYTIIPLRAANARTLIEQSIGRGLRLPYGKRTGVASVDRLNIVAHDKFQEIVDEANRPDSPVRLQHLILDPAQLTQKPITIVAQPQLETRLGFAPAHHAAETRAAVADAPLAFAEPEAQAIAQIAYREMNRLQARPETRGGIAGLQAPTIQAEIVQEVARQYRPSQLAMEELRPTPNFTEIVAQTAALMAQQTIDIPRIITVPLGETRSVYEPFTLDFSGFYRSPPSEELWVQYLREGHTERLGIFRTRRNESRLEDYVVFELINFNDICYDEIADLLYDLAAQTVAHFRRTFSEADTRRILDYYRPEIAKFIHAQMQAHYREETAGYETKVSRGFTPLKPAAYTASALQPILDYRQSPADKSNMARYLFGGFSRCLYSVQKFDSDTERKMAVILERDTLKWFRPVRGQFQIYYKSGPDQAEYQPDFVAETDDTIYMLEPKSSREMDDPIVLTKRDAAVTWCQQASENAMKYGGKPWRYVLIPHDEIADNRTLAGLAERFEATS